MRGPELEARLVGAVLASSKPLELLHAAGLHPDTFSDSQLRTCWGIALDLARAAKRVDAYTVFSVARLARALKDDDLGVLESLQARSAISTESFLQIANDLRRHAHKQAVAKQLGELAREVVNSDDTRAQGRFEAIRENFLRLHAGIGRRGPDVIVQHFGDFDRRREAGIAQWPTTGVELLDTETGGFPPKLCMLLGPPGVMKTGLAASMLERQCTAGLRVLVVTLEDGTSWAVKRPLAKKLGLRVRDVFAKDFPDGEKASLAGQELSTLYERTWFCGREHVRTPEDIVRVATQLKASQNIDLVWVDNARRVRCEPRPRTGETRRDAISRMYELFSDWADKFATPLVLLAHTTRKYEERTRGKAPPVLSDIGETGDAEKDVRYLLALWNKRGALRVTVGKHTEGEPGMTVEFARFAEAAMVDIDSAAKLDLEEEKRKERTAAKERGDEEAVAQSARRKEMREKLEAAKKASAAVEAEKTTAPAPSPQLELIPGGKSEEPKP